MPHTGQLDMPLTAQEARRQAAAVTDEQIEQMAERLLAASLQLISLLAKSGSMECYLQLDKNQPINRVRRRLLEMLTKLGYQAAVDEFHRDIFVSWRT